MKPILMSLRQSLFLVLVFPVGMVHAQLVVDESLTPTQLVNDVLLGGGVTANNISFNGIPSPGAAQWGSGSFTNFGTNLGLNAGIILASGFASSAPGLGGTVVGDFLNTGSDPDLAAIAGFQVFDRSVLEFDFTATGDSIRFRYVFASCEYPDFVCSDVNDAFGFFLSGPGINGPYSNNAANIALIPGTTIPISINTVNNGIAAVDPLYCSSQDPNWQSNTVYFVDNMFINGLTYGGFTVVMEAAAEVQCGETYHIKIAIGDAGDEIYDSAVFLEAGSFTSPGQVIPVLEAGVGIIGNTITEGCGPVEFIFEREGDTGSNAVVDLVISGTATAGVDYSPAFPAQLNFAPGETSQSLFLDVPIDGDASETLIITVITSQGCAGNSDNEFTFNIVPQPPLDVQLDDVLVDCGEQVFLTPTVAGGIGEYTYTWSTGEVDPSIVLIPDGDTTIDLTVGDACGVASVDVSATITVNAPPITITVTDELGLPCGVEGTIEVEDLQGGNGNITYEWTLNGAYVGNTSSIQVTGGVPEYYVVTVTDGCGTTDQDSVLVYALDAPPLEIEMSPSVVLPCDGEVQVSVVEVFGGSGIYTYQWSFNGTLLGTAATQTAANAGTYEVVVTESCGGTIQGSVEVTMQDPPALDISVSPDMEVPCQQQTQVSMTAIGGTGPFTFNWSINGSTVSSAPNYMATAGTPTYYVATISDACGQVTQDSVLVSSIVDNDLEIATAGDVSVICPGENATLEILGTDGSVGNVTYTWLDENGDLVATGQTLSLGVDSTQTFTIMAIDECANSGSTTISAILPFTPAMILEVPNDTLICAGETIDLMLEVTGGSGNYFIDWQGQDHSDPVLSVAPQQDTWYNVTVMDHCGVIATEQVHVMVEHFTIGIVETPNGQPDEWYLQAATSPSAEIMTWDMGDGTRYRGSEVVHRYADLEPHLVTLYAVSPNGCKDTTAIEITPPAVLHFPNTFTPDGDGINDLFGPIWNAVDEFEMTIFDRWGQVVFQTTDLTTQWDGSINGSGQPMTGVYVYTYQASGRFFSVTEGIGHVTVLMGRPEY